MDYGTMTAVAFGVVTLVLLAWLVLQRRPGSVDEAQAALAQAADLARVAVAAANNCIALANCRTTDRQSWLITACWRRSSALSLSSWWLIESRRLPAEARFVPRDAA